MGCGAQAYRSPIMAEYLHMFRDRDLPFRPGGMTTAIEQNESEIADYPSERAGHTFGGMRVIVPVDSNHRTGNARNPREKLPALPQRISLWPDLPENIRLE